MPDLIAQGEQPQQRWRRTLVEGEPVVLGRESGPWDAPWDHHISRRHAQLCLRSGELEVTRLPNARNPIYLRGEQSDTFVLRPGEHFVIGETTFTLVDQRAAPTADAPRPIQQQTFSLEYLKQIPYQHPDRRIEVLSRLPQAIAGAAGEQELCVRLVSMLLAGVPKAQTAAIVAVDGPLDQRGGSRPTVRVLHWDQRRLAPDAFGPSEPLILDAVRQRQSVMHVWAGQASARTTDAGADWAFCVPVPDRSEATPTEGPWALYVAGARDAELSSDPADIRDDMKFAELVAATLSSLRQMRLLERQHASLSQFFSPVVVNSLSDANPDTVLAPREANVSVLFCDLRGFARETQRHADDLMGMLRRVSQALGVMTHQILDHGGVVGDFQGDAAMGFWGWPLTATDDVTRCCHAALAIRREFETAAQDPDSPLAAFRAGIGIATGAAVAGKIGTVDQVKVTVFGPVVNLASRLEGMTKIIGTSILIDEETAQAVRAQVPPDVARVRRLAVVRPYGLDTPLEISELLPPATDATPLSDEHLAHYEAALDAFIEGRWSEALRRLHHLPPEDQVTDFLTVYIAQNKRTPPPNWNGVIPLESK